MVVGTFVLGYSVVVSSTAAVVLVIPAIVVLGINNVVVGSAAVGASEVVWIAISVVVGTGDSSLGSIVVPNAIFIMGTLAVVVLASNVVVVLVGTNGVVVKFTEGGAPAFVSTVVVLGTGGVFECSEVVWGTADNLETGIVVVVEPDDSSVLADVLRAAVVLLVTDVVAVLRTIGVALGIFVVGVVFVMTAFVVFGTSGVLESLAVVEAGVVLATAVVAVRESDSVVVGCGVAEVSVDA